MIALWRSRAALLVTMLATKMKLRRVTTSQEYGICFISKIILS